jgi:hypothetical protein
VLLQLVPLVVVLLLDGRLDERVVDAHAAGERVDDEAVERLLAVVVGQIDLGGLGEAEGKK